MRIPDRARVTTYVAVSPLDAFEVFTEEIDTWWKHGVRFRFGGTGTLRFEGAKRLVEALSPASGGGGEESGRREHEVGKVLVWEPGARLVFEWRGVNFAPDEVTEVEVRFEPMNDGTQVTLEHRGWSQIRPDHPARHGQEAPVFIARLGGWWGDLVTSYRSYITYRHSP